MANELREDKNGRRRQRNDRSAAYPPSDPTRRNAVVRVRFQVIEKCKEGPDSASMDGIRASLRISSLTLSQEEY